MKTWLLKVTATGKNSCKIDWSSSFNVIKGADKEETADTMRAIYKGCYDGITRVLSAK